MNTEHVDLELARYSDWAYTSSIVVLVVALLLLAAELAASRTRRVSERELVGAGTVASDSARPGIVDEAPARSVDERVGRAGLALVYLGTALLAACIVLRGMATGRAPWGNMYEFINLTSFCGLIAALREEYAALKTSWGGYAGYDRWFAQDLTNAHLASVATYHALVPGFRRMISAEGDDLKRFFDHDIIHNSCSLILFKFNDIN